jgi:Cof subfamily protein (haloacid dehalogenase superfamily)
MIMDLIVFDLDGTLLNENSQISNFTKETLELLSANEIAFTVATGRTQYSAEHIVAGHKFILPHIYSNGVIVWDPQNESLSLDNLLSAEDVQYVLEGSFLQKITPFISAVDDHNQHHIYHPAVQHPVEQKLLETYLSRANSNILPVGQMPTNVHITNISMIGHADDIDAMRTLINTQTHLIAYSGPAVEGSGLKWMDIHHNQANKGSAVEALRDKLAAKNVMCFGDSDNDLSMFAIANESFAPSNAKAEIKSAATGVIGHHKEDGVAEFLRERFNL